ncbi:MAG: 23S rRNA (adenine(2503)-C(2))-methyltransferase RlmN, partial [Oscillospiraceae bacterium]|nr:23S rRNA (adenine(2503)-C(2))-methyltransferase RlmN [Oscillospiraceae bacterium]
MTHLRSMTPEELGQCLKELGQPAFRAKQVFSWLHKGVRSYEEMTNLPKALRDTLQERYPLNTPKVLRKQESQKDGTIKYLWELSDGNCVETVLMRYHYGNTVCISTEVGC